MPITTTRPTTTSTTSTSTSTSIINDGNLSDDTSGDDHYRDIHALTPPPPPPPPPGHRAWDSISRRSSNLSLASELTNSSENFTTMSREFNALVLAGSGIDRNDTHDLVQANGNNANLDRIGEEVEGEDEREINPLAIVPDSNPLPSPRSGSRRDGNRNNTNELGVIMGSSTSSSSNSNVRNANENSGSGGGGGEVAVHRVKKEEVETKISAWQTAKIAKINNRFKREDAVISGWENEQVHKASSWMKKVERKLEEKRAKAMEKMQNDVAKAHRKAEERRASAESKRGTKVAKVLEIANLMRAVGRPPAKRSFF